MNISGSSKRYVYAILAALFAFISFVSSAQQLLPVGGGSSVSGATCVNGRVLTWGLNKQGGLTGTLGTGSTAQNVNSPQPVTFPSGVQISQLGAGSGGYFLALDCDGRVWGWGDNTAGNLGNGTMAPVAIPEKVKVTAGSAVANAGFRDPATGDLIKIRKLFTGNSSSFAITNDNRLLSWGCNGTGCDPTAEGLLGNGTTLNSLSPTFVLDGAGNQLTNVIDVTAGDNLAMALVGDVSLGIGTVYSWGTGRNGTLGRNAAGTANNTTETASDNRARPVRLANGGMLTNIKNIAAGDVVGLALDVNGYVWAWGNAGYGGVTGQGTTNTHSDPRRVLAGAATGAGSDGTYLKAISIAAGNGYSMAVAANGSPVAWGNNGCSANVVGPAASPVFACGGNLGNGGVGASSSLPVYVTYGTGQIHNDVIAVSRGDFWGYYIRSDNSIWGWGDNIVGQLGDGSYTTRNRAVPITINPALCPLPDPAPNASITPGDTAVCESKLNASNPLILRSNFKISAALLNRYKISWYKNDTAATPVYTGSTAAHLNYSATSAGTYYVKIEYIGSLAPCGGLKDALSSMTITVFPKTFDAPTDLTFCGNTAQVRVNSTTAALNPKYVWFPSLTSTVPLDTSIGSGFTTIDVSGITAAGDGSKTVFVEEKFSSSGRVTPATEPSTTFADESAGNVRDYDMFFKAYSNITIDTISLVARTNSGSAANATFQFQIYGTTLDCGGKLVADKTKIIATGVSVVVNVSPTFSLIKIPVGRSVVGNSGGIGYFIGLSAASNLNGNIKVYTNVAGFPNSGNDISSSNTAMVDNLTGQLIKVYGSDRGTCYGNSGEYGAFFNWRFSTPQKYCDRIPVVLKESCPCNKPTNVDIKNTKALSIRCIGDTLTLKGDYKNAGKILTGTNMYYVWYKQGATVTAANYSTLTTPNPVTSTATYTVPNNSLSPVALATSGVYVLRVQDGNDPSKTSCYTEDTVTVRVGDRPNRPIYTGDSTLCIGERLDLTAASTAKAGVTIKQYTWKNLTPGVAAGGTLNARITKNNVVAADGTTFKAIVESTDGCKDSSTVTVKVDSAPAKPTFTGDSSLCPQQTLAMVAMSAGTPVATKYKWTFPASTTAPRADTLNDPLNNTLSKTQVAASDAGRYKVVAISALGCKDSATVGIVVNPLPARPRFTGDSLLCEGSDLNLTAASAATAGVTIGNYVWKKPTASTASASGVQGQTMGKTGATTTEAGRYEVVAVSSEGCRDSARVNVKIDARPTVPVINTNGGADIVMCGSDQQLAIDPASYTVGKVKWTNDKGLAFNDAISSQADTLKTTKAIGFVNTTGTAEFTVTVTNGICPAVTDKIKVTRSGELTAPNLVSDNGKLTVCLNGSLSFTGNARSTTNNEVSGWSWSPKNSNITVDTTGANSNKARFTFTAIGSYDIIYTIDNPTCPAKTEKLTVTVVAPPTAIITDPSTLNGSIKEKSINPNSYQLAAQAAGIGYTGTWTKKSGQGTIGATTGTLTGLADFETTVPSGVGTTEIIWTVTDNTNSCPAAKDSARIIRRDITIPNLGPDTVKCESVLPFTRKTNAGDIIPGIETIAWFGQTSFVSGNTIVVPAGTLPGDYQVRLEITNTPAGLTSKDTFNIRVDAESVVPTLSLVGTKANPYLICSDQFTMPGIATVQGPLSVNWWNKISGTGKLTDSLLVNTSMTEISGLDTVTARFWNKNGVCPAKSVDFVLKKVGDITATEVKLDGSVAGGKTYANEALTLTKLADTLCLGGTYTLSALKIPTSSETGTWRVVSGTSVSLGSPLVGNTQSLTVNSTGATVIEWKIENASLASCNPNILQVTLIVQAPPSITSVVGPTTPPCEDDAINVANGRVFFSSTLKNPKFNWAIVPSGTGSATLLTTKDSLVTFTHFVSTATKGAKDSVSFNATVSNACGTDVEPLHVVFTLKPRELYVGDTINGPTIICETQPGVGYLFDHVQPNTTKINWYWNGTKQVTTNNLGQTDTAGYFRNKAWGEINVVTKAMVIAELENGCGTGKDTSVEVTVIPAVDFTFKVISDRYDQVNNSFCVPLDNVGLFALQTSPDSVVQGNVAQYEFANKAGGIFKALSPSRTFYSTFPHDTTVVVNATPDISACLNDYSTKTQEIRLKGYDKPADSLVVDKDTICEDEGRVKLYLMPSPPTRNLGKVTWYKTETGSPVAVGTGSSYEVSGPGEGTYYAFIDNAIKLVDPTSTCPGTTTKEAKVKIYDMPDPVFATDQLVIYYDENSPGIQMPLLDSGTVDKVIYAHYDPGVWLSNPDTLLPLIKTTRDEMAIEYLLTLKTGNEKANAVCVNSASIKVLNALPLRIPNAFSPNNDGKNETWVIDGLNKYPDVKVKVFNRWGNSMFTDQDGVYEPWDGRTNGADLASGTYYYVIDLKGSPDGTDDVKVGSLTIVR